MNRDEAIIIIEGFISSNGQIFIDGYKKLSDQDLISLAEDCRFLLENEGGNKDDNFR